MLIMGKGQVYHWINYIWKKKKKHASGLGTLGPLQFIFYGFIEDCTDYLINAHETDLKIKGWSSSISRGISLSIPNIRYTYMCVQT